jgi:hypothetical protein
VRPLALLFLSIVLVKALVPAMDTTDLTKLPALLERYHEHQALQPYLIFVEFLSLHFVPVIKIRSA